MSGSLLTPLSPWLLLAAAAPLNGAAAVVSFARGSVDAGGAAAGAILGTVVFAAGGPFLWLLLAAFVISSTALTRFRGSDKRWLSEIHEKGATRDALQVLANGGAGMAASVLYRFTADPVWAVGAAAAFASANADTWASEVGVLSGRSPVSLVTLRPVPRGVSGGVTLLGLAAALGGALLVAVLFALGNVAAGHSAAGAASRLGVVVVSGLIGCVLDSVLGSTLQAQYRSGASLTERRTTAGAPNVLLRGVRFITNDVVNLAGTIAAAVVGTCLGALLR